MRRRSGRLRAGRQDAATALGNVDVDFRIPSSGMTAEQQQILDDLIAKGIDGIAASPIDPANETDFLNKIADATLFITTDSDAPKSKRVCYIGTDKTAAGGEAGKLIQEALPNGGKIVIFVGTLDAKNAKERYAGITNELAGSNIQIIDVRTDETDLDVAANVFLGREPLLPPFRLINSKKSTPTPNLI